MNKVLKSAVGAVSAAAVMLAAGVTAFAEDVSLSIEPIATQGNWKQTVVYTTANADNGLDFDPDTMTPDSVVMVEYECTDQDTAAACWIELIWQSWGDNTTGRTADWAKVDAYEFGEGYANFSYNDIVAAYGTEDFSEVYNICVGDKGAAVTAKSVTITNVDTSAAETEAEVTEAAEEVTEAETTEASQETAEEITETEASEENTAEETTAEETTTEATEAETEKETEAETTAKTEKVTEAKTEAAAASTAPVSDDGDIAGIILVIAIVLVAAAIIIIVYLTVQRGGYNRRGK